MKRIFIALSIIAVLSVGSGAAYASDLNFDEKIQQWMDQIIEPILVQLAEKGDEKTNELIAGMGTETTAILEKAKEELQIFGDDEKDRIDEELSAYKDAKIDEVKELTGNNSNKKRIEDAADAEIAKGKAAIDAEIERLLSGK